MSSRSTKVLLSRKLGRSKYAKCDAVIPSNKIWTQRTHLNTGSLGFHNWCIHLNTCTSNSHLCSYTSPVHTGLLL